MKQLFKITGLDGVSTLGPELGDIVEAIGWESSEGANVQCVAFHPAREWRISPLVFRRCDLAPLSSEEIYTLCQVSTETPVSSECSTPTSPSNPFPLPEVPPEAKEASTVLSVPSTSTSHDAHYASMAVEPVTISEMMMENEAIPPRARYHAAKAVEYFTRAGRKEGQDWKKEFEKALNHGYRAIHGKWPWETRDR